MADRNSTTSNTLNGLQRSSTTLLPEQSYVTLNGHHATASSSSTEATLRGDSRSPQDPASIRPSTAIGENSAYNSDDSDQGRGNQIATRGKNRRRNRGRPQPDFNRAKSDVGPRNVDVHEVEEDFMGDETWTRHGFDSSDEHLKSLTDTWWMYFTDVRHETGGNPKPPEETFPLQEWRMRDRLKTVSAALALCLNLGVDPPDVIRTSPSARMECWVDPTVMPPPKALENIGKNLQVQYETLSLRTRYKQYLDPSIEETKKFLTALRRNAKDERVLFHYNGHGVPKPTPSGEIWVFNKNYTQYIPISLYDIQLWLGSPALLVYDCSDAGNIIYNFNRFVEKRDAENAEIRARDPEAPIMTFDDCIQLAACGRKETLPTNPDLPADLFTCCLTTPIEIALRFFVLQNPLPSSLTVDDVLKLPGRLQERRTPQGELNWIFTAITDTIAWNTLPRALFKKLFRQDLMVAALFRNFLLSQRIMRIHKCHPQSWPVLPETHHHPLWESWDLALEMVCAQLPALLDAEAGRRHYEYQHSTFFAEQLTAFEVYLARGAVTQEPPDQLPIVLQVLLSQVHRLRALILLSKFLDLGPWAVNLALSIGIFPYVLKLLQSAASELKPVMVFIWARILAVDQGCQEDLLKDNGYQYFISILSPGTGIPVGNASEHRAMCAFIITMFCRGYKQAQRVCLSASVIKSCLMHLTDEHPLLRQWASLCIAELWVDYPDAKWDGISMKAHEILLQLRADYVPEVRAAMLHALDSFLGIVDITDPVQEIEEGLASALLVMANDGSSIVRKELLVFFSTFVKRYENKFMVVAYEQLIEEREYLLNPLKTDDSPHKNGKIETRAILRQPDGRRPSLGSSVSRATIFGSVWKEILVLSVDPHPEIANYGSSIVDYVYHAVMTSPLGTNCTQLMEDIRKLSAPSKTSKPTTVEPIRREVTLPPSPSPKKESANEGYLSMGIKRTASNLTSALTTLAFGGVNGPDSGKRPQSSGVTRRGTVPQEWNRSSMEDRSTISVDGTKAPMPRAFRLRDLDRIPKLPLRSTLVEWSIEYFRVPQMKQPEAEEPGSKDYNQRLWRRSRNERIMSSTQPQKEQAGSSRWDSPAGFFNNILQPSKMVFHQFEDHLIVADDRSSISIWDWYHHTLLNRFTNANPTGSKISDLRLINEDDVALLMTGSSDGVVKVYRNYEQEGRTELVSAWRALTDIEPREYNASLAFEWLQGRGRLLVAGDMRVIRVWNALTEICMAEIPARTSSPIVSLTSEQAAGDIFAAGFLDGAVRIYDQRHPPRETMVRVWKSHRSPVVNIHMQRGGQRELISASRNGEVLLWDIRMAAPLKRITAVGGKGSDGLANAAGLVTASATITGKSGRARDELESLSVHEHDPVFATGDTAGRLAVYNTHGVQLSSVAPVTGGARRGGGVAVTAFHPHRMVLAASVRGDGAVSLWTVEGAGRRGGGGGLWDV